MLARPTIIGSLSRAPVLRNLWIGRAVLALLLVVLIFFSFFPERYRAAVTLTPTDPTSLGLNGALGQLGALNGVFGNQSAVEVALKIGRSVTVQQSVAQQVKLMDKKHFSSEVDMDRWLADHVDVRSLRGGIIQFEMISRDPELAKQIVGAFAAATQKQLSVISRRQTEYKRDVLVKLVTDASDRLARARGAYDNFRLQSRYTDPKESITAIATQIPEIEGRIRSEEVRLSAARQFATDNNVNVQQIVAQLNQLRRQLAQAKATNPTGENSVGRAILASTEAQKLERELKISQTLYDNYLRTLEGTTVEDLASTASVRILEQPFIDSERQINWTALAAAIAVFLLWAAIEFYRLRPPVGERVLVREG